VEVVSVRRRLLGVPVVVSPHFQLAVAGVRAALPGLVVRAEIATTHKTPQAVVEAVAMVAARGPLILERLRARAVPAGLAAARVARVAHLLAHSLVRRVVLEQTESAVVLALAVAVAVLAVSATNRLVPMALMVAITAAVAVVGQREARIKGATARRE
jgi:hypothetical protein